MADLLQFYENLKDNEKQEYAFIEMNIKNSQFFSGAYDSFTRKQILSEFNQILATFFKTHIGAYCQTYDDTYHFFIKCEIDETKTDDENALINFLIELTDLIFDWPYPLLYHNIYTSFGILLPRDVKGDYASLVSKAAVIRKNCKELSRRSFSFDVYNDHRYETYLKHHQWMREITDARTRDEFTFYVQPKVDLKTEKIIGGEVLLRWINKNNEMVPLSSFLPYLNRSSEIYLVDLSNFRKVCAYLKEGLTQNQLRVPMSFNVSDMSFSDRNFIDDYSQIVNEFDIPHHYLEFEFMEDIPFDRGYDVLEKIKSFQDRGFSCSLDDFGSGNSSFVVLMNHLVDTVKLDRMFFIQPLDETHRIFLSNLIKMIKSLGFEVLAEGIEQKEYIDLLKALDCDYVQGFYYYHPMPLDEFQALLEAQEHQDD